MFNSWYPIQNLHLGSNVGGGALTALSSHGGISCAGGRPTRIHSSFTLCCSSVIVSPAWEWAFCARTTGEQHLTLSAVMGLIMPAASRLSNVLLRYACAGSEKVWFPIFVGNIDPGLMSSLCTAPGMAFISLTDSAKQSANSATRVVTRSRWSLLRSGLMVTSSSIFWTRLALCGVV